MGLPAADGSLALTSEADRYDRAAGEKAAAAVLRKTGRLGTDDPDDAVWERLTRHTLDGVGVPPLGTPADLEGLSTAGRPTRQGPWDVRVAGRGGAALLDELENGATSVWLRLDGPVTPEVLAAALDGVLVDLAPVVLDAPDDPVGAARSLTEWLQTIGTTPAPGSGVGADPVGSALRTGQAAVDVDTVVADVAAAAGSAGVLALVVDGTVVHDLGASDAQELGYSLATGAAYLRALGRAGVDVERAVGLVEFRYAVTDEQLVSIAKLRAARRCWARLVELCGVAEAQQRQHAVTSRPMMSRYDPYVNLLRTTVAAFAAGVGGADAVTVRPFDSPLGEPDAFGRRMARNISSLLVAESHVAAVADPAGGAYAVERLTDELAAAAWAELQRLEASGGVLGAWADGSLQARVDEVVAARDRDVATRRRPLTGVSEFPNLAETLPERAGGPDPVRRYGAAYEAMRDAPASSPVFLATMGSVAAHSPRALFATNLFAAGGVGVEVAGATGGADDVVAAYAGQPVVCLAGPDAAYAEWGPPLVAALRGAGATRVILAGKPGEGSVPAELVDDSCAVGVDAVAFLTRTREALEVAR
ncbi:methylmalonyl-CoA mutase family protein [Nocardioides sp.]|uniref:methylmalonyl-CoA mutase family protein n=1 Tax=Nocardioides sp. TaxID=35761 RepID=UPI0035281642